MIENNSSALGDMPLRAKQIFNSEMIQNNDFVMV